MEKSIAEFIGRPVPKAVEVLQWVFKRLKQNLLYSITITNCILRTTSQRRPENICMDITIFSLIGRWQE
jgi:hypothetical protein